MPKFGASIYGVSRHIMSGAITPAQGVEWLCREGAEVIEIVPFGIDLLNDSRLADEIRETAAKYGIPVDNYSLNANFLMLTDDQLADEIARVKSHIDAASKLGISTFRCDCAAFRRPIEINTIEAFIDEAPIIARAYESICGYAEPKGIKILMENHGFHANGSDRVRYIIKQVKSSNFGHQLDVGNYLCMDEKPEIATLKMLPFATTIHMKDFYVRPSNRDPGDATLFECSDAWFLSSGGQFLRGAILGQGDLDMHEIIRVIKTSGFDGNIYIEYEGMEDCYYGTKVSLENLKRIYKEV